MSRILLIRPPQVFSSSTYCAPVTLPHACAYLSANLLKHGHEVRNIDALGEGLEHIGTSYGPKIQYRGLSHADILARIVERPDGIGVTAMFSQDWPHLDEMIAAVAGKFPGVPIILGGEHATAASAHILETCPAVTHVALGEGEETIVEWADWLDGRRAIESVAGLHYRSAAGPPVKTAPRQRLRNIDDLPWPAWDLFDLKPYFQPAFSAGYGVQRGRSMPVLATRGCPYRCTFCSSPSMWTTRYVMRSVPLVVDEIEHALVNYGAENIDFPDLTAVLKKEWIIAFCREIKRRRLDFTWQLPSGTRSEAMDGEVLGEMFSAGCRNVCYAPESGSLRTLEAIKKKIKLPRMADSLRHAKALGIAIKCNFIIGFPDETRWDVLRTVFCALRFAFIGVDDAGLYLFSPYPGSELYDSLRARGVIGAMDRDYFESLLGMSDISRSSHYCEKVGPRELAAYRFGGMLLFYFLSYLLFPRRILRFARNYSNRRSDSTFESRLFGLFQRLGYSRAASRAGSPQRTTV